MPITNKVYYAQSFVIEFFGNFQKVSGVLPSFFDQLRLAISIHLYKILLKMTNNFLNPQIIESEICLGYKFVFPHSGFLFLDKAVYFYANDIMKRKFNLSLSTILSIPTKTNKYLSHDDINSLNTKYMAAYAGINWFLTFYTTIIMQNSMTVLSMAG